MRALAWKFKPPPAPYTAPTFNGRADGANGVVMAGAGGAGGRLVCPAGLVVVWLRSWEHSFLAWCIGGDLSTIPLLLACAASGAALLEETSSPAA